MPDLPRSESHGVSSGPGEASSPKASQPANPLHGITLETMVTALAAHYGWDQLGQRIAIRCFISEPSVASSLKFLRKTPWARDKVEGLYLFMLREARRAAPPVHNYPPARAGKTASADVPVQLATSPGDKGRIEAEPAGQAGCLPPDSRPS
jgi:uncharacterized protein (DUF2132 family)